MSTLPGELQPGLHRGDPIHATGSTGKQYHAVLVGERKGVARIRIYKASVGRYGGVVDAAWSNIKPRRNGYHEHGH